MLESPFTALVFHDFNLQLVLIPFNIYIQEKLAANFFVEMANAYPHLQTIYIWEDEWYSKNNIIKNRLSSKLRISERVHGRKTIVKRIDKAIAYSFMQTQHLQGYSTGYYKYGLYEKTLLYAVALFSKTRKMWAENYISAELIRYANLEGHHVSGGLSKLINHYIQEHKPNDIMTYVDRDWGNGDGYIKIGFEVVETTPAQAFWVNPKTYKRYHQQRFCKEMGIAIGTPAETIVKQYGLIEVYNSGNIKMIKPCSI